MSITRLDILEAIKNGESSTLDFKRDVIEPRDLAKLLVAFANLKGGSVLLGVEDDGSVSGITRPNIEEWVMQVCRDKIRPEIIPSFHIIKGLDNARDVAVVSVDPGYAVHSRWDNGHRTYYIRVGTTTREASTEELERLLQQRGSLRIEMRPLSGSSIDHLDRRRLREYFERIRQQETPDDGDFDSWKTLLQNTEIMEGDRASLAGMLLFGNNVNRFLPQAGITAAAYKGTEKDYDARRATIRGPLVSLRSAHGLQEAGVVEQALAFVREQAPPTVALVAGQRVEQFEYPEDAVREVIVNALIHRDYSLSGTDVELALYADRLEVISPGNLPNGITPDRMKAGCRVARNQLLRDVMHDYGYLESVGMGIPRKVVRLMHDRNNTTPDLIAESERFTVRLWKRPAPPTSAPDNEPADPSQTPESDDDLPAGSTP